MCEIFSNVFQAKMHLMSECWRHAWSSRLPKNPKIHLFKQNLWIQVKKMDFWISQGFFWIFLDSSKGCLDFWVSKSKTQNNSRKKMDFCKNPTFTCIFLIFWKNPSFSLSFFGFLISGLEKSIFFLVFLDFCKNPSFPWVFYFFWKFHLFPWVFLGVWLGNPKIQTPFRRIQKNPKKPWEIQKSIFLTWIQRFCLKRWIFGFLVEQSSEIQDFIVWTWIQVFKLKDGLLYFCFHFLAEFRRLKQRINQEWLQLSFDIEGTGSMHFICVFPWFFHHFILHWYVYICLSPLGPTKCRAWGGLWPYIYIYIFKTLAFDGVDWGI